MALFPFGFDLASGRKKILIIDDEFGFGDALRKMFTGWFPDYDVEFLLNDPKDKTLPEPWAYTYHQRNNLALVVSDCAMPRISGINLCKEIRHHCPKLKVVLMSSNLSAHLVRISQLSDNLKPHAVLSKNALVHQAEAERLLLPLLTPAGLPQHT
jgi:DNA-binding NarL/FixJ family response regulator